MHPIHWRHQLSCRVHWRGLGRRLLHVLMLLLHVQMLLVILLLHVLLVFLLQVLLVILLQVLVVLVVLHLYLYLYLWLHLHLHLDGRGRVCHGHRRCRRGLLRCGCIGLLRLGLGLGDRWCYQDPGMTALTPTLRRILDLGMSVALYSSQRPQP